MERAANMTSRAGGANARLFASSAQRMRAFLAATAMIARWQPRRARNAIAQHDKRSGFTLSRQFNQLPLAYD
jgi:hypothetical protein